MPTIKIVYPAFDSHPAHTRILHDLSQPLINTLISSISHFQDLTYIGPIKIEVSSPAALDFHSGEPHDQQETR